MLVDLCDTVYSDVNAKVSPPAVTLNPDSLVKLVFEIVKTLFRSPLEPVVSAPVKFAVEILKTSSLFINNFITFRS